jgi:threonine aldolase
MPNIVDLRSDTVTRPSPGMKQAMMAAEVGDDVLGDDPTVIELQRRMAGLLQKEAALFVPSGTMANQLAIRAVCEAGDEIILHESTHSYNFETGAASALAGCSIRPVPGERGVFEPDAVRNVYRPFSDHFARSRMVIVENTNNRGGGSVWPLERIAAIQKVAREFELHLHLDGARLWNASVASACRLIDYAACADTVSMCFSKGLGAPVGSILVGPKPLIQRAHRFRKMYGGAMRQAGILAAAALYALDHNIERLAEDHENARHLAEAIAALPGIHLDPRTVETNIVIFEVAPQLGTAARVIERLRERDVWMLATGPTSIRAVTHLDVSRAQIDQAIADFRAICSETRHR